MKKIMTILSFAIVSLGLMINVKAATLQSKIDAGENNIVLDQNYTEDVKIENGKNVTIDLNGYTLTGFVEDLGELTIKSSKEGGKLIVPEAIYVGDFEKDKETGIITKTVTGKFTLESGTIVSADDYGIYCMSGSTAIINGGVIESLYAGLTGNNTTGTMNFVVNGGTITTSEGPAIYMPGPVSLTMTGGTLNGGISLRMGKINISGGTINATNGSIDSFAEYYKKSENAWLADALYVWGGTYTSKDAGETNELVLNITGGTFNVTNKQGSAIAIYDIGRYQQDMSINISKNAKLITNSTSRNAYDVLSLKEAGVENPVAGFNNPEYVGKVETTITGGSFSSSVAKYLNADYMETLVNNIYIVGSKNLTIEAPSIDKEEVTEVTIGVKDSEEIKDALEKAIKDGKIDVADISPVVVVVVDKVNVDALEKSTVESIDNIAKEKNIKITNYFDITLNVQDSARNEVLGTLNELSKEMTFNVAIPKELTTVPEGYNRKYYVVRYHDGKSEILETTANGNILTFKSDKFSTYALAYEDIEIKNEENPKTADNIITYVGIGIISIAGISLAVSSIIKRKKYLKK